ncbi:putative RING finger protein nhl-1-like [Apostichopus japonicus]|uniref:Putative RING finger protein nhl-1-like n=1 Tax=Stichopus japonicus TaxID=307972 RepID=A0A2G8K658_STIJA|nr:putative RING finger protein nhl-1-like [Apostichopus japonicus]
MSDPDGSMGRLASVQDELESMVECPVHFGVLVQPKSLPWVMSSVWIALDAGGGTKSILVCPECNNEQILPRGGVEELPNSYRLMKLCEYLGNLNIVASALEGDAQANTAAPPVMRCDDHEELPLDRICRDCRQPVCQECMRTQHAGHLCLDGSTFLRHMDRPLKKLQDQAKMKQREAERCLVELKKMKVQLNVSRESANSAIDHYVMRLMEKATQAGIVSRIKWKQCTTDLASLPPLVDDTSKRLKDVETITVPSAPVVSSDIWVEMNEGIFDWFKPQGKKEIGQVVTSEVACPSECVVEIVSKRPTLPFEEVVVVLTINDGHGSQVKVQDINFISAEVVKANGNKVQQVFESCGKGKFVTSFTPQSIGKYLLIVKAYNQKVKNSPLKILVKPRGKSTVDLKGHPTFSAIHDVLKVGDNYLVLDSDNVNMVDKEGRLVNKFVIKDRVFQPYAVACHNQAYYVTALKGKKVVKFSRTGLPLLEIGHGILQAPTGIAVAKDGTIYVADDKKSCIYVFRSDGQLCHLLSGPGSDREQISHPWYIKFNTHGHLVWPIAATKGSRSLIPSLGNI